ncbi:MAG: serpin family protein [Lawsonibacter sp.]|jgi:serine protease inhibitor
MKRILVFILIGTLALAQLSSCTADSAAQPLSASKVTVSPSSNSQVNQALSTFGLHLLQKARETQSQEPVLLSPLSVALALSMAANGADGNTLAQFEQILGGGAALEELNAACAQIMKDYQNLDGSTDCSIANSIWVDPDGHISNDFIGRCSGIFDAQVFQEDLSNRSIVSALNSWVSQHTNKMIPQIISQPFQEETAALLVNALYLKNTWAQKFDPNSTGTHSFTYADGHTEKMDFLNAGYTSFPYLQGEGVQGVVLPYDDERLGFFALLPDQDLGSWLNSLEGTDLVQMLSQRTDTHFLHLGLPKFETEWKGSLVENLISLGLKDAFLPGIANFSQLGELDEGYYLSQVIHAAKIEVNENGTEAAAATIVATSGSGAPLESGITLVFDRPFLYGIVDLESGIPLFLGTFE